MADATNRAAEAPSNPAPQPSRRRLAIISTYNELCGIAGYTKAVVGQLEPLMQVKVFDLDQYLLRTDYRSIRKLAEKHIKSIASELPRFDAVNIQLEHGTIGRTPFEILRRLRRLAEAAPQLTVTFHTILHDDPLPWSRIWHELTSHGLGGVGAAMRLAAANRRESMLANGVYSLIRRLQRRKTVNVIVHTKRDMRYLRDVHRIKEVFHHPLAFIGPEQAAAIRAGASRDQVPILRNLPPDAKLIGTFGFLSPYKGFETAIEALKYLPDDYHLLIFGGIHPQTIQKRLARDPYIQTLLDEANIGRTILDTLRESGASMTLDVDAASRDLLARHPHDLHARMHFMGVLGDAEFLGAMALCDAVVLPYLEVGQSSSGPISMALDMGCRVLASRTKAFLELAKYHSNKFEMFDIGNFAELAARLRAQSPYDTTTRTLEYNAATNAATYAEATGRRSLRHRLGFRRKQAGQ